jgi:hypothetical protein
MEGLTFAFWAWIGWNILAPLATLLVLILIILLCHVPYWIKQARCKHPKMFSGGVAGTEQYCVECRKFICYTWEKVSDGHRH